MKGTVDITAETDKREISDDVKKLTILNLEEGDEGEYTASTSPAQKFQVQVVDCIGSSTAATPGLCQGKPGGRIKLALSDGTASPIAWKKATDKITANNSKYPGGVDKATLTIKNLDDEDEAKFTGGANGEGEHFSVQVADCFGGDTGTTVTCEGKQGKDLKLRISGSVTSGSVTWAKVDGTFPGGCEKPGPKDEGLQLKTLTAPDAGTYKATYDGKTVSFTVSIPGGGGGGGGGGGRGNTTDTVVVRTKPRDENGQGGGGSVLSYSPALLVTVTLVHLLLQLAA
ncbi:uncharacterized protein [Syngnathus scovelli]|uniref:uncharacterized protein n=1 Tax=Syngnathus scovelli TaxID=161590 RepID=UPI00210F9918|nr:uncharacterized protein LOC125968823 [Syngnathus scovelli]